MAAEKQCRSPSFVFGSPTLKRLNMSSLITKEASEGPH